MKKVGKSKEKSTKSANTFCRNKPNSPIVQTDVTFFTTMYYTNFASLTKVKNKPNQTQFKANSNPISKRPKMNISNFITINYEIFLRLTEQKTKPNKAKTNPILFLLLWFKKSFTVLEVTTIIIIAHR